MILSRQKIPQLKKINGINAFAKDGYIVGDSGKESGIALSASRSEVYTTLQVKKYFGTKRFFISSYFNP